MPLLYIRVSNPNYVHINPLESNFEIINENTEALEWLKFYIKSQLWSKFEFLANARIEEEREGQEYIEGRLRLQG